MRDTLRRISAPLERGTFSSEDLLRPQETLFAETSRLISAVLAINTEGFVPSRAAQRAAACLQVDAGAGGGSWARPAAGYGAGAHGINAFLTQWFELPELLAFYGGSAVRSAYDCAPKRYRAHFLCALARLAHMEGARSAGCVRQSWSDVWNTFPELSMWQELRETIRRKCLVHGRQHSDAAAVRERSRSPAGSGGGRGGRRSVKDREEDGVSKWAKRWRKIIRAVLPGGEAGAAAWSDPELRKLCAALWRDFADPLAKATDKETETARRALGLFRTESRGVADVTEREGAAPAEWAFVPAADLLLLVGEGLVGITVEGVFADSGSPQRLPYASAIFQTMMAG